MATGSGSSRQRAGSTRSDRGSAVLETALVVPVLLAVTVVLLVAVQVGMTAVHLSDTAFELARGIARGVPADELSSMAAREAPAADLEVEQGSDTVTVHLVQDLAIPVPILGRFEISIERSATAPMETG